MPLMHIAEAILGPMADWGRAMFPAFAQAAAPAEVAALWQGAAVAVALVLCLRFAPRVSAAQRFALWVAGFAVVSGLPFLPLFVHLGRASAAAPIHEAAAKPLMHLDIRWAFIIAAVWLAASAIRAGELAFHAFRVRRLWKAATPVAAGVDIGSGVREMLAATSNSRRIEICTTRDLDSPSVIGFFAPRILIPEWLFSRLTPGELEQVVLHETEHLRRRDDWTNLLQKLSLVLFPLNPGLVWMERRLCREREMACDEGVVRRTQAPRAYAACLTTLAERGLQQREMLRRAHALSLGAFSRRPELVHRVHSILRRKRALNPLAAGALVGVVGFGLVIGALELSRSPQLVAFVATPEPRAQVAALDSRRGPDGIGDTDAVFHPSHRVDARETKRIETAIETKVILSARRNDGMALAAARPRYGDEESAGVTETAAASRAVLVNAAMPKPADTDARDLEAQDQRSQDQRTLGQEYVVLTAWEELRTSSSNSRIVADYSPDVNTQEQSDDMPGQPDAARNSQITVTRMILVIYPVSANPASANPTSGATRVPPAPTSGSTSHRPTASYGGWLFFQL